MDAKLYVIGYRALRHEKFFGLLNEASVPVLLDVRMNPYSPNPDYQKASIAEAAPAYGVKYFHVPALGVPGAGRAPILPGAPATFDEQMATPEARRALGKIVKLIKSGHSVALMCSEPNYVDCHRRKLVAMLLEAHPELEFDQLTGKGDLRLF